MCVGVCMYLCVCSKFHTLPGGLKDGVQLEVGVLVEMLLGMVLNVVVLHASGGATNTAHCWLDGKQACWPNVLVCSFLLLLFCATAPACLALSQQSAATVVQSTVWLASASAGLCAGAACWT